MPYSWRQVCGLFLRPTGLDDEHCEMGLTVYRSYQRKNSLTINFADVRVITKAALSPQLF